MRADEPAALTEAFDDRSTSEPPVALIVDDSPENRYVLRRALERGGFVVWEAETGEQGLARAAEDPDLVILDVNLPDIHGFEVCRRLKAEERTSHLLVLHVSHSHVSDVARASGLEGGADGYLTEPVDPGVLLATARALVRLRRAEDGLRRQIAYAAVLNRLGAAFADALTREQVVDAVARTVLPDLGGRDATIYLLDDNRRVLSVAHTTLAKVPEPFRAVPVDGVAPVAEVARTGAALFGDSASLARDYAHLADHYAGGAWAAVPLVAFGRLLGALAVTSVTERPFEPADRALLVAIGEQCGQALERAELFEHQRDIAAALQESLLPAELAAIPGTDVAARYRAGARAMEVGGDFYDVVAREDDWLVVVGDVCGRGADAAALTGLARHTVRAEARHLDGPGAILEALHEAIKAHGGANARFVTATCVSLRRDGDAFVLCAARAGHPPPLIGRADGTVEELSAEGPLLGAFDPVLVEERAARLDPGDTLLLYTDGLTEARRGTAMFGDERLEAMLGDLAGAAAPARELVDALVDAADAHASTIDDDLAVLCLRNA
jgi:serine phosphatase RsbU (regulator of sigma subunit)/DNA-binding response OmpR family regulator